MSKLVKRVYNALYFFPFARASANYPAAGNGRFIYRSCVAFSYVEGVRELRDSYWMIIKDTSLSNEKQPAKTEKKTETRRWKEEGESEMEGLRSRCWKELGGKGDGFLNRAGGSYAKLLLPPATSITSFRFQGEGGSSPPRIGIWLPPSLLPPLPPPRGLGFLNYEFRTLAQAASGCAPSVEVLPICDVAANKAKCGNTAKMHGPSSLAGSCNNKRLGLHFLVRTFAFGPFNETNRTGRAVFPNAGAINK
ncbi:hypothetical protein WN51_13986 [Melipona quadrifasciata]|uniref:Uncharacterized protein n=1 Tax=Melipona quadrifasciata TaxID=166423 RepID=A0A0N1ITK9_9HYME|nr:hypothetical protein WN51_13986 [Melipona quadrifasciata]